MCTVAVTSTTCTRAGYTVHVSPRVTTHQRDPGHGPHLALAGGGGQEGVQGQQEAGHRHHHQPGDQAGAAGGPPHPAGGPLHNISITIKSAVTSTVPPGLQPRG